MSSSSSPASSASTPPAVVPRRAFKKSRMGCRTCKVRKVKCDEQKPLCGNCTRRFKGLTCCDFDPFVECKEGKRSTSPRLRNTIHIIQPTFEKYEHDIIGFGNDARVLELRLMHHYTTTTCWQLPGSCSSPSKVIWSIDIPQLAFTSDLVLSALLGISALHLAAINPEEHTHALAAGHYFDQAVSKHRIALNNVEEHSAEALLATATLICHHTWLASHSTPMNQPYTLPLQTYYMARGIRALFDQMWPTLKNTGYLWYDDQDTDSFSDSVDETSYQLPFMTNITKELSPLTFTFYDSSIPPYRREIYEQAITEITSICSAINTKTPSHIIQKRIATMPLRLPPLFLELVEMKDARALVLLAWNLALLKVVERIWWLHGEGETQNVAERAVGGIYGMMEKEWRWAMEWPMSIVNEGGEMKWLK